MEDPKPILRCFSQHPRSITLKRCPDLPLPPLLTNRLQGLGLTLTGAPQAQGVSPVVPLAHAVVEPLAVVVEAAHTFVASTAVLGARTPAGGRHCAVDGPYPALALRGPSSGCNDPQCRPGAQLPAWQRSARAPLWNCRERLLKMRAPEGLRDQEAGKRGSIMGSCSRTARLHDWSL